MENNLNLQQITFMFSLAENALRLNIDIDPIYDNHFTKISQKDAILIMKYFYIILLSSLEEKNAIKILDKEKI